MSNFEYIVLGIGLFVITFCAMMCFKNEITFANIMIISDAIYAYNLDMIEHNRIDAVISFNNIASYYTVVFRLWDWGYKHIVPPEIFEVIKPYIKKD